jgi:predicted aspartyl protease
MPDMGTFSCPIEIMSSDGTRSETADALVDTGSTYTSLPDSMLRGLNVVPRRLIQSESADGSVVQDAVGEARVRVEGVETTTIVVFVGEDALALQGVGAEEGALLVVDPVHQWLIPTHALRYGNQRCITPAVGSSIRSS